MVGPAQDDVMLCYSPAPSHRGLKESFQVTRHANDYKEVIQVGSRCQQHACMEIKQISAQLNFQSLLESSSGRISSIGNYSHYSAG